MAAVDIVPAVIPYVKASPQRFAGDPEALPQRAIARRQRRPTHSPSQAERDLSPSANSE